MIDVTAAVGVVIAPFTTVGVIMTFSANFRVILKNRRIPPTLRWAKYACYIASVFSLFGKKGRVIPACLPARAYRRLARLSTLSVEFYIIYYTGRMRDSQALSLLLAWLIFMRRAALPSANTLFPRTRNSRGLSPPFYNVQVSRLI